MAGTLNKTGFISDLKDVFSDMKSNDDLASGLASATKTFIQSGMVTTSDSGTIMSGTATFAGGGSGSMTVTASLMENKVKAVFSQMTKNTDDGKLAKAIADGVKAMAEASDTISTTVTGVATNTQTGVTSPVSGSGKGDFSGNSATIETALNSCFSKMKNYTVCYKKNGKYYTDEACTKPYTVPDKAQLKETDADKNQYIAYFGDTYFAECMADAVGDYLTAGSVSTNDSGTVSGASGSGSIA